MSPYLEGPYLEGYAHAFDPNRSDVCPYPAGTEEHEEWWRGYGDCVDDAVEAGRLDEIA